MQGGTKVYLRPIGVASEELCMKIAARGDLICEVAAKNEKGVCTVLLPEGVVISGYSRPCGNGQRHYIDMHESHLVKISS